MFCRPLFRRAAAAFAAVLLSITTLAPSAAEESLTVGSAHHVAVSIERDQGHLISLRVGGREFISYKQRLFYLLLTDPKTRKTETLSSRDASEVTFRTTKLDPGAQLVATYTFSDKLTATVTFTRRPGAGLETAIEVANLTGRILEQVHYPNFKLRGQPGRSPQTTKLFMPGGDGYVISWAGLQTHNWHQRAYPGHASMQFMAYYDKNGGLTLQTRDPQAQPKEFGGHYDKNADRLTFVVIHHCAWKPDLPFRSAPIALLRCEGHWMSAAAQYREWARRQWWAKPKMGDAMPPKWLGEGFLTLGGNFRPLGMGKHVVPIDKWPQVVRKWRQATGATRIMLDVRGWEQHGQYCSPFYFPMYPSKEKIKAVFDACRAERAYPMAMIAGLKWMIHRKPYPGKSYHVIGFDFRDRFDDRAKGVCVLGRDGKVLIREPYFNWDGRLAYMCPAHQFTRDHFLRTARTLAEAGFALFEFDQMNGGSCPHCYRSSHAHPPGPGTWQRRAIGRIIAETRAAGRKISERFATSLEDPQEVYLQQLDSFVSRAGHISKWPGAGSGSLVVPAFSFVYHPLARAIGFDVQCSPKADPYQILQLGRYFITGVAPSTNMGWWQLLGTYGEDDLLPEPKKIHADQLELLAAITATHCGPGLPYLGLGEMLAADTTDLCPRKWSFRKWTGKKMVNVEITHPAVMASAWQAPSGRRAFVFVSMDAEARQFDYDFSVAGRKPHAETPVIVHVNARLQPPRTLGQLKTISMPALSTLLVEMK